MNLPFRPIFADAGALFSLAMALIFFLNLIIQQINKKRQAMEPPVQRPGKPVRPRNDRIQDEIDIFIQEVNQQRPPKPTGRQETVRQETGRQEAPRRRKRPESPPPAPPPAHAAKHRPPGGEITNRPSPMDAGLGRGGRPSLVENIPAKVQADLAPNVSESVTSHLGAFSGGVATPAGSKKGKKALRVKQLFQNVENVRQAILINAILSRPKSLQK